MRQFIIIIMSCLFMTSAFAANMTITDATPSEFQMPSTHVKEEKKCVKNYETYESGASNFKEWTRRVKINYPQTYPLLELKMYREEDKEAHTVIHNTERDVYAAHTWSEEEICYSLHRKSETQ